MAEDLRDPWLVAVWPGMGSVALIAGSYLLQELGAQRVAELDGREYFEIQNIEVLNGLATPGTLPRCLFFQWRDPNARHDVLMFIGEAQPQSGGYGMCQQVLDYAAKRGVRRVFTFAAMATQLHPGTKPRVFGVATDQSALTQIAKVDVEMLAEGQVSGLNGVMLAAAAERGMHAACLLGELPYFAVAVPNPRAAQAVLERFTELAGISVSFAELAQQAKVVERQLRQLLEQMQAAQAAAGGGEPEEAQEADSAGEGDDDGGSDQPQIDPRTQQRIEMLFEQAGRDRSKAFELKQELDRLGVFKTYEDRFLDLFRKGE